MGENFFPRYKYTDPQSSDNATKIIFKIMRSLNMLHILSGQK